MEKIRPGRPFQGGSDLICAREFLQSWNIDALEAVNVRAPQSEPQILTNIAKKMSVSDDTVKELADVCGLKNLLTGKEPKSRIDMLEMKSEDVPPKAQKELETLRTQIKTRKRRFENDSLRSAVARHMKYSFLDEFLNIQSPDERVPVSDEKGRVPVPNVILTVQVIQCLQRLDSSTKGREFEQFNVLATQTLADLRDKIKCSSDAVIAGEFSSMPDIDSSTLQKAGDLYKSSFFFLENVFYNDMRNHDNKDYSKPIMKWAQERCGVTDYVSAKMEDTSFLDLKIRLGRHYLFLHQGSCEHAVMFTDMRLFTAEDSHDIKQYPQLVITRMKNRSVCQSCTKFTSKWIVQDSPLIPTDPCFLCKLCFKKLLYTKDGQKTSKFRAYHCSDFYS